MDIIDRLEKFMDERNLNNNQVTTSAGLSNGLIGKARKSKKGLHSDTIEKILYAYPDLNPNWFIKGEGEMLVSKNNVYETNEPSFEYKTKPNNKDKLCQNCKDKDITIEALRETIASLKSQIEMLQEKLTPGEQKRKAS